MRYLQHSIPNNNLTINNKVDYQKIKSVTRAMMVVTHGNVEM